MGSRVKKLFSSQSESSDTRRAQIFAYSFAVAVSALTLLARLSLSPWVNERPLLVLFLFPIIFSAYFGGLGPGLIATFISAIGTDYFLFLPIHSFLLSQPLDIIQLSIFTISGVLISTVTGALHQARQQAENNRRFYAITLGSIGDAVITTD